MVKTTDRCSARQRRHLAFISEFTTYIQCLPGKDNVVADCLLCSTLNTVSLGIDYTAMADGQIEDEDVQAYATAITNLQLKNMSVFPNVHELLCYISAGLPRPVVTSAFRRQVFDIMYNLAHPGKNTTRMLISRKFVLHGLKTQVNKWAKKCLVCEQSKLQRRIHAPQETFDVPEKRFSHIHVELFGPLPPSRVFTYLFTIFYRYTRWPEAIPLKDPSSKECAHALISTWISRFDVPLDMTYDQGRSSLQLYGNLSPEA